MTSQDSQQHLAEDCQILLVTLRIEQGGLGVKRDALFEELSIYHIKDESCV